MMDSKEPLPHHVNKLDLMLSIDRCCWLCYQNEPGRYINATGSSSASLKGTFTPGHLKDASV